DLVRAPGRLDLGELPALAVEVDERSGLLVVHLEARGDDLLPVVVALKELAAAAVAHPFDLGRVEDDVIHRTAARARAPAGEAPHQLRLRNEEADHLEIAPLRGADLLEPDGLSNRTGKTVEDEALGAPRLCEAGFHQVENQVVRHEHALVHE